MKKHSKTPHWIFGTVLLLTSALIIVSLVTTYVQGQGENQNLPANVTVNNQPPEFLDADTWQQPQDQGLSSFDSSSPGATLTGVVNGVTSVIINVNVRDLNGYSAQNINVQMRLARSSNTSLTAFLDNYNGFDGNHFPQPLAYLPERWPVNCVDLGEVTGSDDKEHTWRCTTDMLYYSDPTIGGPVTTTQDLTGSSWKILLRATDDENTTDLFHEHYFEWPQIIGIANEFTYVHLGTAITDGSVIPDSTSPVWTVVGNAGNAQLDESVTTTAATDEAAWYCTGGGTVVPHVYDIRVRGNYSNPVNSDWNVMKPLNYAGESTHFDQEHIRRTISLGGNPGRNFGFRFATTQPVASGLCTLSDIVFTAYFDSVDYF